MPKWLGPTRPQVFEHHQLFAWSISLPSWKSVKRNKKKPTHYVETQTAELSSHSQKWSLHLSLAPENISHGLSLSLVKMMKPWHDPQPKVTWEGDRRRQWTAAIFSHGTGMVIPIVLGHKKQARCPSSVAGPSPKGHTQSWAAAECCSQPPVPEAHTPDVADGNKGQMCELDA